MSQEKPKRPYSGKPNRNGSAGGKKNSRPDNPHRGRKPRPDGDKQEWKKRERTHKDTDTAKSRGRGGTRGAGKSDRGGKDREYTEAERLEHSLRPVREAHKDPQIPGDIKADDLHPGARNELKTLDAQLAETVARHLACVAVYIDSDPELANQHAISAMRKAGRIPVTRETYAITSYTLGDFATALRELRTYRRLSGSNLQLALMIDSERGLGRPLKALELAREVDVSKLPTDQRVQVAIALSGARLDLGQTLQALYELEIPELDPKRAFSWSPDLFYAYATVLEDLGRFDESKTWERRAEIAQKALDEQHNGTDDTQVVIEELVDPQEAAETEMETEAETEADV